MNIKSSIILLLLCVGLSSTTGCSKKDSGQDNPPTPEIKTPTVVTVPVSSVTAISASCGGSVTSDGGATVAARGVVWSASENPTVESCSGKTTDGSGTGDFASSITELTASTTYYVRAYATNSVGTAYGEQKSFTTAEKKTIPTVSTASVTAVTNISASCGGSVTSDGGATVTARGVVWSASENPTVESCSSKTTDGSGTGDFVSSITELTASTTYYVRAYATNSVGTAYGEQKSFTTAEKETTPTVSTASVTAVTNISASCGGSVTSDGGATVTTRGVVWSASENPTVESCSGKTTDGSGTGDFVSSITGLTASTKYYVRAYATNFMGTSYGEQNSFITNIELTGGGEDMEETTPGWNWQQK